MEESQLIKDTMTKLINTLMIMPLPITDINETLHVIFIFTVISEVI